MFESPRGHTTYYRREAVQEAAVRRSPLDFENAAVGIRHECQPAFEQLAHDLPRHLWLTAEDPIPVGEPGAQLRAVVVGPRSRFRHPVEVLELRQDIGALLLAALERLDKGR